MNQEVKAIWTAALRSGEFEQGTNFLRKGDRYCCLGVLCELGARAGVIPPGRPAPADADVLLYGQEGEGSASYLPEEIQAWAGLDSNNPEVGAGSGRLSLASLNDQGETFRQIADLIDAQL